MTFEYCITHEKYEDDFDFCLRGPFATCPPPPKMEDDNWESIIAQDGEQ